MKKLSVEVIINNKIQAIKLVRNMTSAGLKESKDFVEAVMEAGFMTITEDDLAALRNALQEHSLNEALRNYNSLRERLINIVGLSSVADNSAWKISQVREELSRRPIDAGDLVPISIVSVQPYKEVPNFSYLR